MHEQMLLRDKFVAFTSDWGLKSNFVANKLGISPGVLYQFRCGNAALTKTQSKKLQLFIVEYDKAMQLCTDGIARIKNLSATMETNSDNKEI